MLLSSRRVALLHACLAAMEMAWFTPIVLLVTAGGAQWSPAGLYLGLTAALLAWMLVLEGLSRWRWRGPGYELAVLGLILLSSLLTLRVALYRGVSPADFRWVGQSAVALADWRAGPRVEWALIALNLFLWQRAASASSREINFFSVGMSFRLGMLLLFFTGAVWSYFSKQDAASFLWLYFALGLIAVGVARVHEGALGARSAGEPLAPSRLAQLGLAVAATVGLAVWLAVYYTEAGIGTAVRWLQPLWDVLGFLLLRLLEVIFWLLTPLLAWLQGAIQRLDLRGLQAALDSLGRALAAATPGQEQSSPPFQLPAWTGPALRDVGIALAVLIALGAIWLYLERVRGQRTAREPERESGEAVTLGGGILGRTADRLADWLALVRRFGLSSQLLAAVSVQNIYANVCRMARRRGYPRRPSQPPDDYLPLLAQAFEGQAAALGRITAAYMRVHYGDRPVTPVELAQLRADFFGLIEARKGQD
jgi:hypothetical protein